ncbi:MAG: hypothetical protein JJE30_17215 [Desulfuromonadales bacterium]|nr:hypothetical protein [Desulfuromonadales bacterium]
MIFKRVPMVVLLVILVLIAQNCFAADFIFWNLRVGAVIVPVNSHGLDAPNPNVKIVGPPVFSPGYSASDFLIADPFDYHMVPSGDLAALGAAVYRDDASCDFVPPGLAATDIGFTDTGFLYVSYMVSYADGTWGYKPLFFPAVATSDPVNTNMISANDLIKAYVNNSDTFKRQ